MLSSARVELLEPIARPAISFAPRLLPMSCGAGQHRTTNSPLMRHNTDGNYSMVYDCDICGEVLYADDVTPLTIPNWIPVSVIGLCVLLGFLMVL